MARYLGRTESNKLLRKALKNAFPGVKFRVAGPGSPRVEWMDGPTKEQVQKITRGFNNKHFDGMIDMTYYSTSWLLPDGTLTPANCDGCYYRVGDTAAAGAFHYPKPHPDAEEVSTSTGYITLEREYSLPMLLRAKRWADEEGIETELDQGYPGPTLDLVDTDRYRWGSPVYDELEKQAGPRHAKRHAPGRLEEELLAYPGLSIPQDVLVKLLSSKNAAVREAAIRLAGQTALSRAA